jgi:surfeit locus 1 family protein
MKRLPVLASLIVLAAIVGMIALGFWQLQRADEKAAMLKQFDVNLAMSSEMAFPLISDAKHSPLFRRASGMCLEPLDPRIESGRNVKGASGWRHIVTCRTGAEGPGMIVDIGWSKDFKVKPSWKGGAVSGTIASAPDHRSLIGKLMGHGGTIGLMLIAATPASGLEPSASPTPLDVPNNHMAYAVQWFLFAAIALGIYLIALRRRWKA